MGDDRRLEDHQALVGRQDPHADMAVEAHIGRGDVGQRTDTRRHRDGVVLEGERRWHHAASSRFGFRCFGNGKIFCPLTNDAL